MEFLRELHDEQDYDLMSVKLTQGDRVSKVKEIFPKYNTRVLLSAFMVRNFQKILDIPDNLFNKSEEIINILLGTNDPPKLENVYPEYFNIFNAWRNDDINKLKDTIEIHKIIYNSMLDSSSPQSEADQQWHDGISQSIEIFDKHIDKLDNLSKTPPKFDNLPPRPHSNSTP